MVIRVWSVVAYLGLGSRRLRTKERLSNQHKAESAAQAPSREVLGLWS